MALNLVTKLFSSVRSFASPFGGLTKFHSMAQGSATQPAAGGAWSLISVRTNIRNHFPKPRENKRIGLHSYEKRIACRGGRLILMRRILRGRHNLSH